MTIEEALRSLSDPNKAQDEVGLFGSLHTFPQGLGIYLELSRAEAPVRSIRVDVSGNEVKATKQ